MSNTITPYRMLKVEGLEILLSRSSPIFSRSEVRVCHANRKLQWCRVPQDNPPMIKGIRLKQHIVEGDYVATVFDMETINGVDHVFDRIQVVDEEIKGIQVFYYPQQP